MVRRLTGLIVVCGLVISGCAFVDVEEARIVSFSLEGFDVTADIDPAARTVIVSAPAVDLASVTPVVGLSPGATLATMPTFSDGVPTAVTIVSEDGNGLEWTVTINLRLGISFTVDGTWVLLTEGYTDTSNETTEAEWGYGVPAGTVEDDANLTLWANDELYDLAGSEPLTEEYLWIEIYGTETGSYTVEEQISEFGVWYWVDGGEGSSISFSTEAGSLTVQKAAASVGEVISGTFAVTGSSSPLMKDVRQGGESTHMSITNGYFKVERLGDDRWAAGDA